jgi:hypothetical protein
VKDIDVVLKRRKWDKGKRRRKNNSIVGVVGHQGVAERHAAKCSG